MLQRKSRDDRCRREERSKALPPKKVRYSCDVRAAKSILNTAAMGSQGYTPTFMMEYPRLPDELEGSFRALIPNDGLPLSLKNLRSESDEVLILNSPDKKLLLVIGYEQGSPRENVPNSVGVSIVRNAAVGVSRDVLSLSEHPLTLVGEGQVIFGSVSLTGHIIFKGVESIGEYTIIRGQCPVPESIDSE